MLRCAPSLRLADDVAGIMGELTNGNADIAAFPLSLTLPRPAYVDLSYSYLNGGIGILVSTWPRAAFSCVCTSCVPVLSAAAAPRVRTNVCVLTGVGQKAERRCIGVSSALCLAAVAGHRGVDAERGDHVLDPVTTVPAWSL